MSFRNRCTRGGIPDRSWSDSRCVQTFDCLCRCADSDAEDEEAQGSPMRSRVEDEDMLNRLSRVTSFQVLQLHAGSNLTRDLEKHGIDTMDLGGLDIDTLEIRERITAWV